MNVVTARSKIATKDGIVAASQPLAALGQARVAVPPPTGTFGSSTQDFA